MRLVNWPIETPNNTVKIISNGGSISSIGTEADAKTSIIWKGMYVRWLGTIHVAPEDAAVISSSSTAERRTIACRPRAPCKTAPSRSMRPGGLVLISDSITSSSRVQTVEAKDR